MSQFTAVCDTIDTALSETNDSAVQSADPHALSTIITTHGTAHCTAFNPYLPAILTAIHATFEPTGSTTHWTAHWCSLNAAYKVSHCPSNITAN